MLRWPIDPAWRPWCRAEDREGVLLTDDPVVCIFTVVGVEPSPADLQEMSGCVCFGLRRATRAVTQFYDSALKPHRLRATQLPILAAASRQESAPLAPLAQELGMDRTTLLR